MENFLGFLKIPLFGKKKLLLSFEYAVVLSQVMKDQGKELTPEIVARCENIILKEFSTKSLTKLSTEMIPNLLASIETD
jgi:hypothetical protein